MYDGIYNKQYVMLKIVYNKKKIQTFGMNMPFISSREASKASQLMKYVFFASLDEINGILIPQFKYKGCPNKN